MGKVIAKLFLLIVIISPQAFAQSITILDEQLFINPSVLKHLKDRNVSHKFLGRERVLLEFCSNSAPIMVLSRRITKKEAIDCLQYKVKNVSESLNSYHSYVYFNLDVNPDALIDDYRSWTGHRLQTGTENLHRHLEITNQLLPGVLMTATPETCTTNNSLACADGYYCCKGTCIPDDESCK